MKITSWLKKFWYIRKLNLCFSGCVWYGFSVKAEKETFYLELFIASQKKLVFYIPKHGFSDTNKIIVYLQSLLDAWNNPRINGFHIWQYVFRNKLTLVDRRQEKTIASFWLLSTPIVKRTP